MTLFNTCGQEVELKGPGGTLEQELFSLKETLVDSFPMGRL